MNLETEFLLRKLNAIPFILKGRAIILSNMKMVIFQMQKNRMKLRLLIIKEMIIQLIKGNMDIVLIEEKKEIYIPLVMLIMLKDLK